MTDTTISTETTVEEKRKLRRETEKEVERLIDFLDQLDGDPDLEPAGDEQDQSYPERGSRVLDKDASAFEDAEEDDELEENGDREPSLGSLERHPHGVCLTNLMTYSYGYEYTAAGSQELWSAGGRRDYEDEHDGAEPDCDAEPDGYHG